MAADKVHLQLVPDVDLIAYCLPSVQGSCADIQHRGHMLETVVSFLFFV